MSTSKPSRTPRRRGAFRVTMFLAIGALTLGACADTDASNLTGEAAKGEDVARDLGCTQCHSAAAGVNVRGPSWAELAGSEVTFEDGTKATADREYLARAIEDPSAEIVDGFKPIMPTVPLDETQLNQVIAYIEALGEPPPAG